MIQGLCNDSFYIIAQCDWIPVAGIFSLIQLNADNIVIGHALLPQITVKECEQQHGLPASSKPCDNFDLPVPHVPNQLLQIKISFQHYITSNFVQICLYFEVNIA